MQCALVIPLLFGSSLVGVICLAKEEIQLATVENYDSDMLNNLSPFIAACSNSVAALQAQKRRVEAEQRWLDRKRTEMASDVNKAKDLFIANMSHEIRTPLNGIIGMTKIIRQTQLDEDQNEYMDTLEQCGTQLLGIVNDVLDYSKITSNKLQLSSNPFALRECLEDAYEMISLRAKERNLALSFSIEPCVPSVIKGDVQRLRQILINLLSNAVKFTEYGEVVTTVSAQYVDKKTGSTESRDKIDLYEIQFAVRDTGIGISEDDQLSVFDSFSQVENDITRTVNGTGLGLTISKSLAELMGGRMWLESQLGKGSTFYFTIRAEEHVDVEELERKGSVVFAGKRVLIVDDNAANRLVLFNLVLSWKMQPCLCSSAEEAMMYVRSGTHFDIAFIDIRMPKPLNAKANLGTSTEFNANEQGVRLALRMREAGAVFPFVALSSVGDRFEAPVGLFHEKLSKPVREKRLFQVCEKVFFGQSNPVRKSGGTEARRTSGFFPSSIVGTCSNEQQEESSSSHEEHCELRILIAEDRPTNQKVVTGMLKTLGYDCFDMASNGVEALEYVVAKIKTQKRYDVLLLDIRMPLMDGFTVAKEICRSYNKNERPFMIAVTASVIDQDQEKCKQSGMNGYLSKPIVMTELETMLQVLSDAKKRG